MVNRFLQRTIFFLAPVFSVAFLFLFVLLFIPSTQAVDTILSNTTTTATNTISNEPAVTTTDAANNTISTTSPTSTIYENEKTTSNTTTTNTINTTRETTNTPVFYPSSIQSVTPATNFAVFPTITLKGNAYERIAKGQIYHDAGVAMSDDVSTLYVLVDGRGPWSAYNIQLGSLTTGIHIIEYHAANFYGNRTSIQRIVEVFEVPTTAAPSLPASGRTVQDANTSLPTTTTQTNIKPPSLPAEDSGTGTIENVATETKPYPLDLECKEARISNIQECRAYMEKIRLPVECGQAGIQTKEACDDFLFAKRAPQACLIEGITNQKDCELFMFSFNLPSDCAAEGILQPEACKKFIIEKYSNQKNLLLEKYPQECKEIGAGRMSECFALLEKKYTPQECQDQGIVSGRECNVYLTQKYIPQECRAAGIVDRAGCNKSLFEKYSADQCKEAGIATETGCKEFFLTKYASRVLCQTAQEADCHVFLEKQLGDVIATQKVFDDLIAQMEGANDLLHTDQFNAIETLPLLIPTTAGLRLVDAKEHIVIREDGVLLQTPPFAWINDSDGDHLPDELELRIGTNPGHEDSDKDGITDFNEMQEGQNPLGKGKTALTLSPIEIAFVRGISLEHPKVAGFLDQDLVVESVSDAVAEKKTVKNHAYLFKGKADPDSIVTVYLYSEVPLVVTIKTDPYGNWQYELNQPLSEGAHEMYVAVNDNTGKVIRRSNPLNFFVQEAQAFSVNDFVAAAAPSETASDTEAFNVYLLIVVAAILVAILFLTIVVIYRDKFSAEPQRHEP